MDDVSVLFEAIRALGIAGGPVFAVLWWLERAERKECQKVILTISDRATGSIITITAAISELREGSKESVNTLSQLIRSLVK